MSITDRLRETPATRNLRSSTEIVEVPSTESSVSSTLAVVDPVERRTMAIMRELSGMLGSSGDSLSRIVKIAADALLEEIAESPSILAMGAPWLIQFGELMKWAATGDPSSLREDFLKFACKVDGLDYETIHDYIFSDESINAQLAIENASH